MVDLHRHDMYSLFDGFGRPEDIAKIAKEYGYNSLSISNHGTTAGWIDHYRACKKYELKPILGVEVYFVPKFVEGEMKDKKRYHLCLFAQNLQGYQNINRICSYANIDQFYTKPLVTFDLLQKYSEGVICTSACIAGYAPQKIIDGNIPMAQKYLLKMLDIFPDRFYIEIQPYDVQEEALQLKVNLELIKLSDKLGIPFVLTSDSHYYDPDRNKEAFKVMHCMRVKPDKQEEKYQWVESVYGERYLPQPKDFFRRFKSHFHNTFVLYNNTSASRYYNDAMDAMDRLEDSVQPFFLDDMPLSLPVFSKNLSVPSNKLLQKEIKDGLKAKGKYNREYLDRCKREYKVINHHGLSDYFLIVQDYVRYAKKNNIAVGPGRGSGCNSLVSYALGITDVDSIFFDLNFDRFLRMDKLKFPDIDIDFEQERRQEVIQYLVEKYKGRAVQICSYGLYKVDNLLNDLFKYLKVEDQKDQKKIKKFVKDSLDQDGNFNYDDICNSTSAKKIAQINKDILWFFNCFYKRVKYIGTHAAGVAIVGTDIMDYVAIERHGGVLSSAYDLNDLEQINVIKFDILGLKTLQQIKELESLTGVQCNYSMLDDDGVYSLFQNGETDGVFQFESKSSQDICKMIGAQDYNDVIASNALNRPGPLSLGMHEKYSQNKMSVLQDLGGIQDSIMFPYTKDTYGTIVYQEQIISICRNIGLLEWEDCDKILKMIKHGSDGSEEYIQKENELRHKFVQGSLENGVSKDEAKSIFGSIMTYSFNKGHATGYSLLSIYLAWFKLHYPFYFWYTCLKYAPNDKQLFKYKAQAIQSGFPIMLPTINSSASFSIGELDGENVLQEGLTSIKGIGTTAAKCIEEERKKNGDFKGYVDLVNRCPKRQVNAKILKLLEENKCFDLNPSRYMQRVLKYNKGIVWRSGLNGS